MPTDNEPGDFGEVGQPPLARAVANAIARLTGKRLRTLPFPEAV
jgi:isoquinoline 1-oxidoreductase subunit beta